MSKQRICVIEDNNPIRMLFSTLLKKAGYEVVDFHNGQTAVEWLMANECFGIITDIFLPDISGNEVLNMVRQSALNKDIPAIAVTGYSDYDDREKFLNYGFKHYMTKPVDVNTFVTEISRVFNS
ncbi:MAG: hypothetical protein CVV22_12040 [Ignavibacteriae bacterium HGW-Ignavibacteriae-1]|jgi:CheY-like chemotaxis protein|nr:MAG: hypothetical protein CVV22_12040 [Ignavibacteriae bacterium HGW-Ignavibacteriae-1]